MSNESAKTTKAYKVSPEIKDKLENLFAESGIETQEAFIEHIATMYELQRMKEGGAAGYKKQLDELEYHSRRSVEIFLGMIETESAERFQLTQQHEVALTERAETIFSQEQELADFRRQEKQMQEDIGRLSTENSAYAKQAEQLAEISRKDNLLVEEYRQRIDTLSGLVNEYKAAGEENSGLKTKITELTTATERHVTTIEEITAEIEKMRSTHAESLHQQEERSREVIQSSTERKDVEKEREMLAIKTEYQEKLERLNEQYTGKLRELYDKIDKLRNELVNKENRGEDPTAS